MAGAQEDVVAGIVPDIFIPLLATATLPPETVIPAVRELQAARFRASFPFALSPSF